MCGRYVNARARGDLLAYYEATEATDRPTAPSWNVAPTQVEPIITERLEEGGVIERQLITAKWGLVPSWSKDAKGGSRLINARSETILEKPSFRKAAVKRRAVAPAEGYFEWEKSPDGKKIPTYLYSETEDLLSLAGLYEFWPDPALPEDHPEKWLLTFTILTTTAQDSLGHIHDRSPVIVPKNMLADWLDPATTKPDDIKQLLKAFPEPVLTPRVVSDRVNSVRNNGPELIEAV